jgi:gliding motility-associated lipoprotein GldH
MIRNLYCLKCTGRSALISRLLAFLFLWCISFGIQGCDDSTVFEKNQKINDYNWDQNNVLTFLVDIDDTTSYYNFYLNVRNAGNYRFSNLFIFINTRFPNGRIQRDTAECTLASPDGKWLGEGLGDIWNHRILFKEHMRFNQAGEYRFDLIQAMRVNPLPGIMDAGIRVEKEKK